MIGAEKPSSSSDLRQVLDLVATWAINDRWTIGLNGDFGTEQRSASGGGSARWTGIAGYLRLNLSAHVSLALLRGEMPQLSSGVRPVDWVYVDDAVEGLIRCSVTEGINGKVIDLGSGELVTIREVAEELAAIISPDAKLNRAVRVMVESAAR